MLATIWWKKCCDGVGHDFCCYVFCDEFGNNFDNVFSGNDLGNYLVHYVSNNIGDMLVSLFC